MLLLETPDVSMWICVWSRRTKRPALTHNHTSRAEEVCLDLCTRCWKESLSHRFQISPDWTLLWRLLHDSAQFHVNIEAKRNKQKQKQRGIIEVISDHKQNLSHTDWNSEKKKIQIRSEKKNSITLRLQNNYSKVLLNCSLQSKIKICWHSLKFNTNMRFYVEFLSLLLSCHEE